MILPIESEATGAFNHLESLKNAPPQDPNQKVYFGSIANVKNAFLRQTSFFKRVYLWLFKSKKTVITIGTTQIPVFSYNNRSNVKALRKLFASALDSESIHKVEKSPEKVLKFVLDLEKKAGCADEKESCYSILSSHFLTQLKDVSTQKGLIDLCTSPEGTILFSKKNSDMVASLLQVMNESPFLSSSESVGQIYEYLGGNKEEYENTVWSALESKYVDVGNLEFSKYINCLRRHGMKLLKLQENIEEKIEQQRNAFNAVKEELIKEVYRTSQDNFGETISRCNNRLYERLKEQQEELAKMIPKDNESILMQKKALQGQLGILAEFTTKSIDHFISMVADQHLSLDQEKEALSWMKSLLVEVEALVTSPRGSKAASLMELKKHLQAAIAKISTSETSYIPGKSEILPKIQQTVIKVAGISKKVFKSLPFVLTFVVPPLLSVVSGYKGGGGEGAVIAGAFSVATSLATPLIRAVSTWAVGKVADIYCLPDWMKKGAKATFSLVFQMGLTYMAMQANCMLAGAVGGMMHPLSRAVPVTAAVLPSWLSKVPGLGAAINWLSGVSKAGQRAGEESIVTVKVMGDFLGEEALLFRAIFRAPEKGWPILSRISNIFSKQVSVGVAAYKLGQRSIQSLKAVGHFFTSLAGIS